MNSIETVICLILLFMAMPDLCQKIGRPAMVNAFFVVFGLGLGLIAHPEVTTMIQQAGEVGFLLVLFEVGLEIELPGFKEFLPSLHFAGGWALVQYPLVLALATVAGLPLPAALLASAALTGCSISMTYPGWKHYPGLSEPARALVLQIMVALEVITMVVLTVGGVALKSGFSWLILARLAGMAVMIYLISRFASHLVKLFQLIIQKTTQWRVHFLVLLVLIICAIGERIGLSAAKTAFFLGLFMSRAEFQNQRVDDIIAPISRRFLIPIFFVSLGLMINVRMLFSYTALLALCGAFLLIGFRDLIHRRWFKTGGDRETYLLFCPNLTMVAVAAASLLAAGARDAATWTVLCGLFLSVAALSLLPRARDEDSQPVTVASPGKA
ncbi:MAG: cation:proton antiporter [Verrucomicrobiota bacterium]|jgi:Kef-type K+ transport system membrane component KefB